MPGILTIFTIDRYLDESDLSFLLVFILLFGALSIILLFYAFKGFFNENQILRDEQFLIHMKKLSKSEEEEIKILSKLVKQRKDSAAIFAEQNREDLAESELAQAEIISQFLPAQLSEEKITVEVMKTIAAIGAEGMKDMGKVMGIVSQKLAGQADGKTISNIVKAKLS